MKLIAYHNDQQVKEAALAQIRAHVAEDRLLKGYYWKNGMGSAVGCQIHSGNYVEYESRFGIPEMLAWLEDAIFEGLPNDKAQAWPERFMSAIRPGDDLSRVGWQFVYWLLTDATVNPAINDPMVAGVVQQCAGVLLPLTEGAPVDALAASAALDAARAASGTAADAVKTVPAVALGKALAARSAASTAGDAARAANAAQATECAMWIAASVASAAEGAANAASETERTEKGARAAAYIKMADKLISLIEGVP